MEHEEPAHLFLKANGADIPGEAEQLLLGRENSIQLKSVRFGLEASINSQNRRATGVCKFEPLVVTKLTDKSTPLLAKAACKSERIEAEVKFYRHSPEDGTIETYLIIKGENGLIQLLEHEHGASTNGKIQSVLIDRVGFVFEAVTWIYPVEGIEYRYAWSRR